MRDDSPSLRYVLVSLGGVAAVCLVSWLIVRGVDKTEKTKAAASTADKR